MAQGTYKINTEPVEERTYDGKNGQLVVWRLGLEGAESAAPDHFFELHKKPGNTPKRGDELRVKSFSPGEYNGTPFTRIFLDYTDTPSGGSSGGGGQDSKNFDRRPEHPRNEARMIHTSALSATPGYIEQMLTIGVADQPKTWDDYWKLVGKVATKLSRSYDRVVDEASGLQQQLPVAGGEVPADTDGLEPQPQVADDKIPF